ncbi:MAG: hypothetical protein KDE55_12510 [Novosphingobium sp.]|nr:hypothetical protein [Novosphingobium sp.]
MTDNYFLSSTNPVANVDQRRMEDTALRIIARPELERPRMLATYLWREVMEHEAGEQYDQFDSMVEEYIFHYAMRAAASDGQHPGVLRFMTPPHRWFGRDMPGSRWAGDSPDFTYRIIPVAHGSRYTITGKPTCGSPPTSHFALMGDNTAAPQILGLLDGLDLETAADGSFTITVDGDPANGRKNHIQTQPGALQIWIRDALGDWNAQSPNILRVERQGAPERDPLSDEELARWTAKALLDGVYYAYYIIRGATSLPPNKPVPPISSAALGGMASQYGTKANVVLEPDEAMILTLSSAGALFRNAVLHDIYMRAANYWDRSGCLNHVTMAPDESGLFTCVIAHEDPGVHNWLDTGGLRQTILGHRWQSFPGGAATEEPTVEARVVKFAELGKALPAGVRTIDAEGRKAQLAARRAGFDKRFVES